MRMPLLAALALAAAAHAAGAEPAKKIQSIEGITEYRLGNGMQVLLYPDASRPKVTVNLTLLVGSRHEGYGETGMAHLLEHMVFKGTPTHPDIPKLMKEKGAQFNGTTWVDRTNYFETLPASDENLEFALKLESDRMMNSNIKGEDLKTEFSVVRNEFESGENDPGNILSQRMMAVAYEWHNYGKSTIGNRSDIERVPIGNLQAFYRKFYQPDNAVLVVAGKFEEPKALALIEKYFGSIPRPTRVLDASYTEEPVQDGERFVNLRRVGDVGVVGLMYHVPASSHPDFPAVRVLANILGTEPAGRLYKALVESKKAEGVNVGALSFHDPGVLEITAEVLKGKSLDDVRDTAISVVEGLRDAGVTDEEVRRGIQQMLKQREIAATDPNRIAVSLSDVAAQGDWRLYFLDRDRLEKVTAEEVKAVAAKYLMSSNRTVGMFFPTPDPKRAPIPASPDVAKALEGYKGREVAAAGESFDPTPENIESRAVRTKLPGGLSVILLPKKNTGESVNVSLTLRYGDADSLKGQTRAAAFLATLMTRGTAELSRQKLQDELDRYRANLRGNGGTGTASFSIQAKRSNLGPVLGLLKQVVREPSLGAEEFEILKRETLAALESQRSEPQALAMLKLSSKLNPYPKGDVRHVDSIEESIEQVKATTIEQVRALYKEFLGAANGELSIVGDFDPDEAVKLMGQALGSWLPAKPYARIERPFMPVDGAPAEAINTPDKANAVYSAGLTAPISDTDPDYPALVIGNYVLGGGALSSRLGDRLRQKEGLSYGAGSRFQASPLDKNASLMIFAIGQPRQHVQDRGRCPRGAREADLLRHHPRGAGKGQERVHPDPEGPDDERPDPQRPALLQRVRPPHDVLLLRA